MSENQWSELVKEQNRTICTLRHMMERGYFIVFLPNKKARFQTGNTGCWALCKYTTPKDSGVGIVLFDTYDDAYEKAKYLVWVDNDLKKNCDTIYPIDSLKELAKKVKNEQRNDEATA